MLPAPCVPRQPYAGSSDAAQDLYGLGVRVGFYLQALGMILYNYGDKNHHGKGLKLASGSITISILASWFIFAYRQLFSPCEAFIVLLILMNLSFPAKTTLVNPETIIGETIGLTILLVTDLGTCAALLWTFATLSKTLPRLQTENIVFFFAKVSITGWFRHLALAYYTLDALSSTYFAFKVLRVIKLSRDCYKNNQMEASPDILEKIGKIMNWSGMEWTVRCLHWLIWIYTIVAVELTVVWNHLSPTNNLQSPGQLIPLITGAIILMDSAFVPRLQAGSFCTKIISKFLDILVKVAASVGVLGGVFVVHMSSSPASLGQSFSHLVRRFSGKIRLKLPPSSSDSLEP